MAKGKFGGAQPRGGRKLAGASDARAWCRQIVDSPQVRKCMAERAASDADFALKLFAHGYGNTPTSLRLDSEAVVHLHVVTGLEGSPDTKPESE